MENGESISQPATVTKEEVSTQKWGNGFLNRPGFFDQIHTCGGQNEITEEWIKIQDEINEEMHGKESVAALHPDCWVCSKVLGVGDYVDGFHPYHQEYNACKECKNDDNYNPFGDSASS